MARGQYRPHGAGRVDRESSYQLGKQAFQKNQLPLPPRNEPAEMNEFYEGYELAEYEAGIPPSQRLNKSSQGA